MGLIPLVIGLYLLHLGGNNLFESYQSSRWAITEGQIILSKLGIVERTPGTSRKNPVPIAKIKYSYTVKGKSYTSSRRSFNDYGSDIRDQQQNIVDGYPVGKIVKVYFDPDNPQQAILEHRSPVLYYLVFGGGVIFALIGYFFIFKLPAMLLPPVKKRR